MYVIKCYLRVVMFVYSIVFRIDGHSYCDCLNPRSTVSTLQILSLTEYQDLNEISDEFVGWIDPTHFKFNITLRNTLYHPLLPHFD